MGRMTDFVPAGNTKPPKKSTPRHPARSPVLLLHSTVLNWCQVIADCVWSTGQQSNCVTHSRCPSSPPGDGGLGGVGQLRVGPCHALCRGMWQRMSKSPESVRKSDMLLAPSLPACELRTQRSSRPQLVEGLSGFCCAGYTPRLGPRHEEGHR